MKRALLLICTLVTLAGCRPAPGFWAPIECDVIRNEDLDDIFPFGTLDYTGSQRGGYWFWHNPGTGTVHYVGVSAEEDEDIQCL